MKNKKTSSFQENIRNMFIVYSLVPVFIVTCLALFLVVSVWSYTTIQMNQDDNRRISTQLQNMVKTYQSSLEEMQNKSTESELYEILYQLKNSCHYQSNFYILNEKQETQFAFGSETPGFLVKPEYVNWGILKQMQEEPGKFSITVQDGILCIGKLIECANGNYYCIFTIPTSGLQEALNIGSRQLIITDEMGWIYYSNRSGLRDNLSRLDREVRLKNGFSCYQGRQYYIMNNFLDETGMRVITITDTENSFHVILLILAIIFLIFLAIGLITFFSTKKMAVKYTQDIDEIADAFEKVENGDLDVKLNTNSSKEFQAIGRDFNLMIDGLKQQIEQNREMTEHVAFAQVKQLESQFNPHFLFNTLDNIRFMTRIDLKAADKMIVSLSRLLRYSIRDAREELTVKEDLDNLQSYFNILQIRFNKRFSYEIDMEEGIMQCLIPKLLIQPLIENAVKYGFEGRETLHVIIKGYEKSDKLIFICQDNGVGMDENLLTELREQLQQDINTSSHMGLYNIHRRIHLLYKENYGMRIESEPGQGTTIVLTMPYRT